jgi:hypothetical protein
MNTADEKVRDRDARTAANVGVRNLAIAVANGHLCDIGARLVARSFEGRGRSPGTGTSAESAHESHQRDRR